MELIDRLFFLALAYTSATEKDIDQSAFLQKVEENQKIFSDLQAKKRSPKVKVRKRSDLGI